MINENFIKIYENSFTHNWDLPGISDYSAKQSLLYSDFAREIARIHILFQKLDVKKGDKIALIGRNNIPWCATYIATFTYGAVIVPILQEFHPENIQHIVDHSDSKYLFTDKSIADTLKMAEMPRLKATFAVDSFDFNCLYDNDNGKIKNIIADLDAAMNEKYPNGFKKEDIQYADVDNSELVLINYTSGTTGFSKGVMLSANNLAGNVTHARYLKLLFREENIVSFLPLAHAYGCAFEFLYALSAGAHMTLLGKAPAPKILTDAFGQIKPRLIISVPLVIEKMYKKAIVPKIEKPTIKFLLRIPGISKLIHKKIRTALMDALGGNFHEIIIGGAALNSEVEAFLCKIKFPLTVGYGMTECGPLISYSHNYEFKPTSCGKVLDNIMQVRIDSEDPYKVEGEIQVKGENVMMGYYKNEIATREAFTEDGWLKTGDLGTVDKNDVIFIRGRSKTMLLSANGQNIFPEEIESKINNLAYISESLVVQRDTKLIALVYPDFEAIEASEIDKNSLQELYDSYLKPLNTMLAGYEKVSTMEIQTCEFEKTPKKSIKRFLYC